MVKEDTDQQVKSKPNKEKNKKEALAQGRSKTNMSTNEKERAPAKNVKKNNLKLEKSEESKVPSRDVSPSTGTHKKPTRKNTTKSDGGSQFSDKQPQARKREKKEITALLPAVNERLSSEGHEQKAEILPKKKYKHSTQ